MPSQLELSTAWLLDNLDLREKLRRAPSELNYVQLQDGFRRFNEAINIRYKAPSPFAHWLNNDEILSVTLEDINPTLTFIGELRDGRWIGTYIQASLLDEKRSTICTEFYSTSFPRGKPAWFKTGTIILREAVRRYDIDQLVPGFRDLSLWQASMARQ